jgi:hypothetical protein
MAEGGLSWPFITKYMGNLRRLIRSPGELLCVEMQLDAMTLS